METTIEIGEQDLLEEWRHDYYRKYNIYENYKVFRDNLQSLHLKQLVADLIE